VLSTLFKVGSLRELKISMHMNIKSKKQPIKGINTIYFLEPTEENYKMIVSDLCMRDLYDNVFLFFSHETDMELLKGFAGRLGRSGKAGVIKQVVQHHFNFISLTNNLFTVNIPNAYLTLNKLVKGKKTKNHNSLITRISHSLLSVIKTLKRLPIIYYSPGHNTEIAKLLKS